MKNIKNRLIPILVVTLAVIVVFSLMVGRFRGPSIKKADIILITAHSLRPDHLSCYGYEHIKTGSIDSLAEKGVLFENAYCTAPVSLAGYVSILSGKHGNTIFGQHDTLLDPAMPGRSMVRHLKDKGYAAVSVTSDPALARAKAIQKEFDRYENITEKLPPDQLIDRGEITTMRALDLLKRHRDRHGNKPIFLWIEYSLPMQPFTVPESFKEAEHDFPYDRQVLLLDSEISKLLKGLGKSTLAESTIIFTATTGASLAEHNEPFTGIFLYNSTVRVPLIIKFPELFEGKRIKTLSSHMDILPTLLDAMRIKHDPGTFDGKSLFPVIRQKKESPQVRSLFLETLIGNYLYGWSPVLAVISDGFKYIDLPEPELYNLEHDPFELKNIVLEHPEKIEKLKTKLMAHVDKTQPWLRAMIDKGADPKEKIMFLNAYLMAPQQLQIRGPQAAIEFMQKLVDKDPDNKTFRLSLATLYMRAQQFEAAKNTVLSLIGTYPDLARGWETLGTLYTHQKEFDKAAESYRRALDISPEMPVALNNLAWIYTEKGTDLEKALEYSQKAVEISPTNANFLDTLAEVYSKMGDKTKAVETLKKALLYAPGSEFLKKRLREIESR